MRGLELKVERLRVGMEQFRLAARLGVTAQFLSAVELGRKRPPAGFVDRYLAAVRDYEARVRAAGLLPAEPPSGRYE